MHYLLWIIHLEELSPTIAEIQLKAQGTEASLKSCFEVLIGGFHDESL